MSPCVLFLLRKSLRTKTMFSRQGLCLHCRKFTEKLRGNYTVLFIGAELKISLWVFKSKTNINLEREREFSLPGHCHQAVLSKPPKKEAVLTEHKIKEGRNSMTQEWLQPLFSTKEKIPTQPSWC